MQFRSKVAQAIVSLVLLSGMAGCSSMSLLSSGPLTADGIPKRQYLVGGGMHIQYLAPADGRLYWVEETTQKILAMRSVQADQETEFGGDDMSADTVKKKLGMDLKDAKFSLYFIPDAR